MSDDDEDEDYLSAHFKDEWYEWAQRLRALVDADTPISEHLRLAVVVYIAVREAYAEHPGTNLPESPKAWHLAIKQIVSQALEPEDDG